MSRGNETPSDRFSDTFDNMRKAAEKAFVAPSPIAYSTDGKIFGYEASLGAGLAVGAYVVIEVNNLLLLGQILSQEILVRDGPEVGIKMSAEAGAVVASSRLDANYVDRVKIRYMQGRGILLGSIRDNIFSPEIADGIFKDATIKKADDALLAAYFEYASSKGAALEIGKALLSSGQTRVPLRAVGFDRHTFLCGQSGSGKTFALGVLIEQLLLETDLRIVIIDPNSDFVNIDRLHRLTDINKTRSAKLPPDAYEQVVARYDELRPHIKVLRPRPRGEKPADILQIRFSDLDPLEQGAVLRMDPLKDREEFYRYRKVVESLAGNHYSLKEIMAAISNNFSSEARQVGLRIENLGLADWKIWCDPQERSVVDGLSDENWRCMVVDIGSLSTTSQKSAVAMAVLGHFWRQRNSKQPVLVVMDEAHNICPAQPNDDLDFLSTELAIRIAGEGRKFGIYLLLASQRPEKIHANVVSQCDNLVLMKMNSLRDLHFLEETFSQVPHSLLTLSPGFNQGEALIAGKFVPSPTLVKFEGRISMEGGSDIPSEWAARKKQG